MKYAVAQTLAEPFVFGFVTVAPNLILADRQARQS